MIQAHAAARQGWDLRWHSKARTATVWDQYLAMLKSRHIAGPGTQAGQSPPTACPAFALPMPIDDGAAVQSRTARSTLLLVQKTREHEGLESLQVARCARKVRRLGQGFPAAMPGTPLFLNADDDEDVPGTGLDGTSRASESVSRAPDRDAVWPHG